MKLYTSLFAFSLILFSCSSDPGKTPEVKETKDSVPAKEKFETGKILEKVLNHNDPSQSYAMYLPKAYTIDKTWPVIYFFDPHATGKLPVSKYKDIAETNGYILIGSNNSQNGASWDQVQNIAGIMFAETQARLSINLKRIYLCGFSGGARIANALCITNGGIAGAICCGAAAPAANTKDPRSNYTFLGICGTKDFNYVEMRKYDMVDLAGRGVKHAFVEFDGKHEWPDSKTMEQAFLWTQLCSVRAGETTIMEIDHGDSIVWLAEQYDAKIDKLKKSGKTYEAYKELKKMINFFDGVDITNITPPTKFIGPDIFKRYEALKKDPAVDNAMKQEEAIWKKEEELQAFYQQAFQEKSFDWWKQDISDLNKKIKNGKGSPEALMYQRTLDYLSLLAYMQTNAAMEKNNLPVVKIFSGIYLLVDPTNSEAHYLGAKVCVAEGRDKNALEELNKAVENGFKDVERIRNDPMFKNYGNNQDFQALIEHVAANAAKDTL